MQITGQLNFGFSFGAECMDFCLMP